MNITPEIVWEIGRNTPCLPPTPHEAQTENIELLQHNVLGNVKKKTR